jgi:hypothetical protein
MTSTAWQSAALERIIVPWAATIAEIFGIIVGLIVAKAGNVGIVLHELVAHAFARELSPEFVMVDQGGRSEARIKAQLAKVSRRLMTVDRKDAARSMLVAGISPGSRSIPPMPKGKLVGREVSGL